MKKPRPFEILGATLAAMLVLAAGCSSDTDEKEPAADTKKDPEEATALDAAANGFEPDVESACMNERDLAGLTQKVDGLTVEGHASVCGLSCIQDGRECSEACLVERIGDLLTDGCRSCAVGVVACVTKNCFSDCLDPSSEACGECACDLERGGCRELFELCTGIENTDCG